MKLDKIQIGFTTVGFVVGLFAGIKYAILMALILFFITSMVKWMLS